MVTAVVAIACFVAGVFIGRKTTKRYISLPGTQNESCRHQTTKKLRVTQMGDAEEWYLCIKCNKKVKESELCD